MGSMVAYGQNNQRHGYLAAPAEGAGPGILLLHAWWGLNDFFKTMCDRLAASGFVAFAPDLYDGKVVDTIDEAAQMVESRDQNTMRESVLEAARFLVRQPHVRPIGIGVVGFSMGAAWAMELAVERANTVRAVVLFYGAWAPEHLGNAHAAFLGHFSPDDEWEPLEGVEALEKALKEEGRQVTFHTYPGTGHWFMEEDRPSAYSADAAHLAWQRTIEFLRAQLPEKDDPLPQDRDAMLAIIDAGWTDLQAAIASRTPDELTRPGPDNWSAKEHIAHVTFWENLMLRAYLRGETAMRVTGLDDATLGDLDKTNAAAAQRARGRSLEEVLREAEAVHAEVVTELRAKPFEHWMTPRFADDPDERPLILWIAGNTWGHYAEHAEYVRRLFR